MREIVILSGKGGTGKTSLTGAFAHLASEEQSIVLCDLDVDASNLHILLDPEVQRSEEFVSGNEAVIDPDRCMLCGECQSVCRFEAIGVRDGAFAVDPMRCEGCKVCVTLCPAEAIDFPDRLCGSWFVSDTRFGTMVHARLLPGGENSGRLVSLLKTEARAIAEKDGQGLILCDGAPGIGCPVISSLAGVDAAVVVTEPTPSGRHDLERVCGVCDHFRIPAGIIVNKCDLNPEEADGIADFCRERGYALLGSIPHDRGFAEAMVRKRTVSEDGRAELTKTLRSIWDGINSMADSAETKEPTISLEQRR